MSVVRRVLGLLTGAERRGLMALLVLMVVSGLLETAGVAAILPFLQLVADPSALEAWPGVTQFAARFGIDTPPELLRASGVAVLVLLAVSNGVAAVTLWRTNRFAWSLQHRLSVRLLGSFMARPYAFYLQRNTAELGKNVLVEVNQLVNSVITPLLRIAVRSISALFIVVLLARVNLGLSVASLLVLGGGYALVYGLLRSGQARLGEERFQMNTDMFRTAQEAFAGIKSVKTLGREREFVERFSAPAWGLATRSAAHATLGRVPRYALETVAFGGIVVVVLVYLGRDGLAGVLPTLGLYAFAAYRLMPSLNEIFTNFMMARFNAVALDAVDEEFRTAGTRPQEGHDVLGRDADPAWPAEDRRIVLEDVAFEYEGSARPALHGIDLRIEPDTTIGLAGATGAGKTTLVDLLLGLLAPTRGRVIAHGQEVTEANARAWRRRCGYVPQDVFLSDDSILANIAFGLPAEQIDRDTAVRAARMAQMMEFVDELPDGLDTVVGERGVRLSGGQRQRIGIARALYGDPDVLVFDEATSALDGTTESAVLDTVLGLAGSRTLILIAHRLTTLQSCDVIYLLDGGQVTESGRYDDLMRESETFQAMAAGLERPGRE